MIETCLFPAAGYGTRFLPATKAMPKEMLPILTKPLIQYGVEEALDAGCRTMAIVTGRGKRSIEDHFDISYELEHQIKDTSKENLLQEIRNIMETATFSYTRQKEMRGLGHAILTGESLVGKNPFAVILADDLCFNNDEGVLTQMMRVYEKYRCSMVAIEEVDTNEVHKYGIIEADELENGVYKVKSMIEVLDVLENFYFIEDLNLVNFKFFIKNVIYDFREDVFDEIIKEINIKVKKSTIAFYHELLNFFSVKNKLDKYLSRVSRYKIPLIKEIFN